MSAQYVGGRNTFGVTGNAMETDRYLDPPLRAELHQQRIGCGIQRVMGKGLE